MQDLYRSASVIATFGGYYIVAQAITDSGFLNRAAGDLC
jgi:hypothetical protein